MIEHMRVRAALRAAIVLAVVSAAPREAKAAFPGRNGMIAFQSNRDSPNSDPSYFEIYVMNADGSGQTRLTTNGGAFPAWSPDGTKIAFTSQRDGNFEIYVMNADGSGQTRLTDRPSATDVFPAWSPDGSKIAFASYGGNDYDIWVMNADGSSQVNVTNNPAEDILPSWSPDGSKIAFQTNRDNWPLGQIYTMNLDGTGLINLSNNPASSDNDPHWSPDGSRLAFYSNREAVPFGSDIYVMNADGSEVTRLTTTQDDSMPAWSPDGSKIAFRSRRDFNDEIYVMNADGSGPTRLTNNAPPGSTLPEDWFPDWQPLTAADTTPPEITCSVVPSTLWPPDHQLHPVVVDVSASDDSGSVSVTLVSIASSQAGGQDDIEGWTVGTDDRSGLLRAEWFRQARTYTLTYEATDPAGNTMRCEALVIVPKTKGH